MASAIDSWIVLMQQLRLAMFRCYKMFMTMEETYHVIHIWMGRLAVLCWISTGVMGIFLVPMLKTPVKELNIMTDVLGGVLFVGLVVSIRLGYIALHRFCAHSIFYAFGALPIAAVIVRVLQEACFPDCFENPDDVKVVAYGIATSISAVLIGNDLRSIVKSGSLWEHKDDLVDAFAYTSQPSAAEPTKEEEREGEEVADEVEDNGVVCHPIPVRHGYEMLASQSQVTQV